ncbi:MAG: hypothetical protein MHM6MM_009263, partial [Cercozoa sp. M6MM]
VERVRCQRGSELGRRLATTTTAVATLATTAEVTDEDDVYDAGRFDYVRVQHGYSFGTEDFQQSCLRVFNHTDGDADTETETDPTDTDGDTDTTDTDGEGDTCAAHVVTQLSTVTGALFDLMCANTRVRDRVCASKCCGLSFATCLAHLVACALHLSQQQFRALALRRQRRAAEYASVRVLCASLTLCIARVCDASDDQSRQVHSALREAAAVLNKAGTDTDTADKAGTDMDTADKAGGQQDVWLPLLASLSDLAVVRRTTEIVSGNVSRREAALLIHMTQVLRRCRRRSLGGSAPTCTNDDTDTDTGATAAAAGGDDDADHLSLLCADSSDDEY